MGGFSARRGRVIVLGGDGMSPVLAQGWMRQGHLPNLSLLADTGGFGALATTNPAESPVAWASFISGKNPGKHGIFDFLHRDPETYLPKIAAITAVPKTFGPPDVRSNRKGASLWRLMSEAGRECVVLRVPTTFPPEPIHGRMMSGLGIPDLRGTWGTSILYGDRVANESSTEMGGQSVRLDFDHDEAITRIEGPKNTGLKLRIRVDRVNGTAHLALGSHDVTLSRRDWSAWLPVTFRIKGLIPVKGLVRFFLKTLDADRVEIYQSPLHWDPREPVLPITHPAGFSKDVAKDLGLFGTLGWQEDTWGLTEARLDDDAFLHELHRVFDEHRQLTLEQLHDGRFDFFISVFESTDRVSHMFMRALDPKHPLYDPADAGRYRNAILDVYRRFDEVIGQVLTVVDDDDTLFVMSDHGFQPVRTMVNVNAWLADNGFLTVDPEARTGGRKLGDLFGGAALWPGVDWKRSRAYALGLSKIYVNLAGRESRGVVAPGRDYMETCRAITEGLKALRDPATGEPVVRNVYARNAVFKGPETKEAGDLVLGFQPGYRTSWQTALGGVPADVLETNGRKWSGDHCSLDPGLTFGMVASNRTLPLDRSPHLVDMAPTILTLLGVPVPEDMDGQPFWPTGVEDTADTEIVEAA